MLIDSTFPRFHFSQFLGEQTHSHTERERERERERGYAKRSMMGAQFLEEMRARRSRRALSTSFRYSVSTTGNAIETLLANDSPSHTHSLEREREREKRGSGFGEKRRNGLC
jgi:hypothetical protein